MPWPPFTPVVLPWLNVRPSRIAFVDTVLIVIPAPGATVVTPAPDIVAFDQLSFTGVAPPASRPVRVAAIYNSPVWNGESGQEAVLRAARYAEQVAINYRPDVMVLGETLNMTSGGGTPDSNAETIPGPSTDALAAIARSYRVNIAFGLLERTGDLIYNTAVLLDRNGSIIGKYQKVQLPIQDVAAGMAPGTSVPVFDTDIGRITQVAFLDDERTVPIQKHRRRRRSAHAYSRRAGTMS